MTQNNKKSQYKKLKQEKRRRQKHFLTLNRTKTDKSNQNRQKSGDFFSVVRMVVFGTFLGYFRGSRRKKGHV